MVLKRILKCDEALQRVARGRSLEFAVSDSVFDLKLKNNGDMSGVWNLRTTSGCGLGEAWKCWQVEVWCAGSSRWCEEFTPPAARSSRRRLAQDLSSPCWFCLGAWLLLAACLRWNWEACRYLAAPRRATAGSTLRHPFPARHCCCCTPALHSALLLPITSRRFLLSLLCSAMLAGTQHGL